ncbi:hypothetical protein GCM10007392_29850 [Saccharospirillum salsuginis]|uniref:Uncharacterized protein n=1 Tax=Saccharospirillum salsuginis TaxID=418750 RepID=A0A918NBB3_9GAMM|nr:hypothetical protein GCM10007392_29850 [Saccharospirillum salsuginis]
MGCGGWLGGRCSFWIDCVEIPSPSGRGLGRGSKKKTDPKAGQTGEALPMSLYDNKYTKAAAA